MPKKYVFGAYGTSKKLPVKKASDDDDDGWYPDDMNGVFELQVSSFDPYIEDTGILDSEGNMIKRLVQPNPIGFLADLEDVPE